jgi:hypothetical protein
LKALLLSILATVSVCIFGQLLAGEAEAPGTWLLGIESECFRADTPKLTRAEGTVEITIGSGNQDARIPLIMSYRCSLFETVYLAAELNNTTGTISGIRFYNSFINSFLQEPTIIWLGNTSLTNLSQGWIPASQMFEVFNGLVDYPVGQNEINIDLDFPFDFNGPNLALMVLRPMDEDYYLGNNYFRCQTTGSSRSRKIYSDSQIFNPALPPAASIVNGQFPKTTFLIQPDEIGSIYGVISTPLGSPLEGVQVVAQNTEYIAESDHLGYFSFEGLPASTYTLLFTKHGYEIFSQSIVLESGEQENLDICLFPMPIVNVTGQTISCIDNSPISGAEVSLEGYELYETQADANGFFSFSGVYANQNYLYRISAPGYYIASDIVHVAATDLSLGQICLTPIAYPPTNVIARLENEVVILTWNLADSLRINEECSPNATLSETARILLGFNVHRLLAGQEGNETVWTNLGVFTSLDIPMIDNTWPNLPNGVYRWAVVAIYSSGINSDVAFSNSLLKETACGSAVGIVCAPNNLPIEDAIIWTGNYSTESNAWGAFILALPVGTYSISARAVGFYPITIDNVVINPLQNTNVNFNLSPVSNSDELCPAPETELLGNYPNPFNPKTMISYNLKASGKVRLEVFNLKGQMVCTLVNENQNPGFNQVDFNALDGNSSLMPSGIYLYRLSTPTGIYTRKMLLLY